MGNKELSKILDNIKADCKKRVIETIRDQLKTNIENILEENLKKLNIELYTIAKNNFGNEIDLCLKIRFDD